MWAFNLEDRNYDDEDISLLLLCCGAGGAPPISCIVSMMLQ